MNTLKTIVLAGSLVALATPSLAAPFALVRLFADLLATGLLERLALALVSCLRPRRGHAGHLQAQRFSDCMMGVH